MKVLLAAINAKYIHSNPAVYSLRAYAADFENYTEIAEYTINHKAEAILADLYRRDPQVIAFSCYIWNWRLVQELLMEVPKILPDTDIWLGGPEVSYDAQRILQEYPELTGIMIGEGEETFSELMAYYCRRDREIADIAGLCLPGIGMTGERRLVDLDQLPFLYTNMADFAHRIIYYESSRGCPYSCSYCLSSIEKRVRLRSLEKVKQELAFFLAHKVPQVKFVDRTFNCVHSHALEVWNFLLENDNGVTNFHFEISADIMTEEELAVLSKMRPGFVQLEIGVQSVNTDTIREVHRIMDLGKLKKVVSRIREGKNIHLHLDLIAGLPFENYDSFVRSFDEVYAMEPDQLQLGFLKVLKGSALYEKAEEYGICYRSRPPYEVLYSKWVSYEEILRLKRVEEMVELYYNSGQFGNTLKMLMRLFPSPFRFYERLAAYYEEQGYFTESPARIYRYTILLAFAVLVDPAGEELYRQLLTYDLYLREKCKSRPPFAEDLSPYRTQLLCREKDKREHLDVFFYPVWEEDPKCVQKRRDTPAFVRFSYEKREPLHHNAQIIVEAESLT